MLREMLDGQIAIVLLGFFTFAGIGSKCVVNHQLKRLVRGAEDMRKSSHPLMKLMRAKFEHACMVSEKVKNVEVFVDKYLYEYKVLGIRLHSWRRLENASAFLCAVTGLVSAVMLYLSKGMTEQVYRFGGMGAALGILVYVFHLTTDENYRLRVARNYMVDYLQNVCLHKYEKGQRKPVNLNESELNFENEPRMPGEIEEQGERMRKKEQPEAVEEVAAATAAVAKIPEPELTPVAELVDFAEVKDGKDSEEPEASQKPVDKDVLIRQILEEFMA